MNGVTDPALVGALEDAQRLGMLGARPVPEVIAHARGFVRALDQWNSISSVLDLGAGGGVPGLVIAHDRPEWTLTLLDRRSKRTDVLERVVRRLGWDDRVSVVCRDVDDFDPGFGFDAVVARGFGPPEFTLGAAARLVRPGQPIVISEPPGGDRWDTALLDRLALRRVPPSLEQARSDHGPSSVPDGLVAVFVTT